MKIFVEYNGEQYGYIINSKNDKKIDYLFMIEVFNNMMRNANILTPELDNFIKNFDQNLGENNDTNFS